MKRWYFVVLAMIILSVNLKSAPTGDFAADQKTDIVIFSYDRPMQLEAFLRSLETYVTGIASTQVIYRVSSSAFDCGYEQLKKSYPNVCFIKQSEQAPYDFKPKVLDACFKNSTSNYIAFGVDDLIMTDSVDVAQCIQALEKYNAYGFYLRLGKNITKNYTISLSFNLPPLRSVETNMLVWLTHEAQGDWSLPVTTDMTIYRKADLKKLFESLTFYNPNNFESVWIAARANKAIGICFDESKVINIPLNLVQQNKEHRNMNFLTPAELLEMFNQGYRIDIDAVSNKKNGGPINQAPHMEYVPLFVKASHMSS